MSGYVSVSVLEPRCPSCGSKYKGPISFPEDAEAEAVCLDCGHKAAAAEWFSHSPDEDGIQDMDDVT